jgi:hypothetical protein
LILKPPLNSSEVSVQGRVPHEAHTRETQTGMKTGDDETIFDT